MSAKKAAHDNQQELKKKISAIKESSGCTDCGIQNPVLLDFDHLRDKKYNISRMVHDGFSWAAIKKEIEKCQVVCSNCHRIRTHDRHMSKLNLV